VPRLDLVQQLNEVEARREEYPETLALLRLLNGLVEPLLPSGPAGGGGGLPDGGADVVTFTGFVQQVGGAGRGEGRGCAEEQGGYWRLR
jgi:nuclear pore complex protein Nup205